MRDRSANRVVLTFAEIEDLLGFALPEHATSTFTLRLEGVHHMHVRPLHDRIIVQRLDEGEQKVGGIIIPDTAKEKPQQGKVRSEERRVGKECRL